MNTALPSTLLLVWLIPMLAMVAGALIVIRTFRTPDNRPRATDNYLDRVRKLTGARP